MVEEGEKTIKRRHSGIRDKDLCLVQIKVSQLVNSQQVTIERSNNNLHTHSIEESFQIKKPSILLGLIKAEAEKNYSSCEIYHAFRGAGTHGGATRLGELGGSSLTLQDVAHSRRGIKSTDVRALPHGNIFKDDVLDARSLLDEQEWLFEEMTIVDSHKTEWWGMVFAHPIRLQTLK